MVDLNYQLLHNAHVQLPPILIFMFIIHMPLQVVFSIVVGACKKSQFGYYLGTLGLPTTLWDPSQPPPHHQTIISGIGTILAE